MNELRVQSRHPRHFFYLDRIHPVRHADTLPVPTTKRVRSCRTDRRRHSVTMAATPSAYIPKRKRLTHDANETNDELSSNIVSYDVYIGRWTQDGSVLPSQNPRHVVENLRNDNIMRSSTLGLARRAFLCSASAT